MKLKFIKFIFVIEDVSVIKCRILYKNFAADLFKQNLDLSERLEEEVRLLVRSASGDYTVIFSLWYS